MRPGDSVDLTVTLTGENGVEVVKTVRYEVPVGAQTGMLNFTVADGNYSNLLDYQQTGRRLRPSRPRSWSRS